MTNRATFSALTPRHSLPTLLQGQVQKEFFVNEALARIDALLHPEVEGFVADPPIDPSPGNCWIVADAATGEWQDHGGEIAAWDGVQWTFCTPASGMHAFVRSSGSLWTFDAGWNAPEKPPLPTGGTTVDAEARDTLASLIAALSAAGIFPPD